MRATLASSTTEANRVSLPSRTSAHAALATLSEHLVEVNALLEDSFSNISSLFLQVSDKLTTLKTTEDAASREALQNEISSLVMKSITDMQFQDRVSQNIVIAMNVMREAADELHVPDGTPMDENKKAAMLHLLNLGDIRQKFLAYSIARGFVPTDEGMEAMRPQTSDDDDIELF